MIEKVQIDLTGGIFLTNFSLIGTEEVNLSFKTKTMINNG